MYAIIFTLLACLGIQKIIINKYNNSEQKHSLLYKNVLSFKNFLFSGKNIYKSRDTYFATLVHDLKTPANAQIRSLKMLLDGHFGTLNAEQYEIIKETLSSEKYMSEIVSDILTAYKYDYSDFKLKRSVFDAAGTLNNVYESVKGLAEDKNQKLNISYNCSTLYINADKLQITRVMANLISNAIKYGHPNSEIKVFLALNNNELLFTVENECDRIPQEKLKRIFDKFSGGGITYYNSASTGLGLYLSRKIIEMHGGEIFAKNSTSGTCVFGFRITVTQLSAVR